MSLCSDISEFSRADYVVQPNAMPTQYEEAKATAGGVTSVDSDTDEEEDYLIRTRYAWSAACGPEDADYSARIQIWNMQLKRDRLCQAEAQHRHWQAQRKKN